MKNNLEILKKLEGLEQGYLGIKFVTIDLEQFESILPTRLSNKTFNGILNFMKATNIGSTTDQIQKALVSCYSTKYIFILDLFWPEKVKFISFSMILSRNICTLMYQQQNAKLKLITNVCLWNFNRITDALLWFVKWISMNKYHQMSTIKKNMQRWLLRIYFH